MVVTAPVLPAMDDLNLIGIYLLALCALLCLCVWLVPHGVVDKMAMGNCLLWGPVLPIMLYTAFSAVGSLGGSLEDRWFGSCEAGFTFIRIYCATQLLAIVVEVYGIYLDGGGIGKRLPTMFHHILSLAAFGNLMLVSRRMVFWAALAGVCETTNIFLTVLMLSKTKGGPVAAWMSAHLGKLLMANGFFLWLSFIVFRIILFPAWLILMAMDLHVMPSAMRAKISTLELTFYPAVTLFLFLISWLWFVRIHAGVLSAIRAGGDMDKSGYEGGAAVTQGKKKQT